MRTMPEVPVSGAASEDVLGVDVKEDRSGVFSVSNAFSRTLITVELLSAGVGGSGMSWKGRREKLPRLLVCYLS